MGLKLIYLGLWELKPMQLFLFWLILKTLCDSADNVAEHGLLAYESTQADNIQIKIMLVGSYRSFSCNMVRIKDKLYCDNSLRFYFNQHLILSSIKPLFLYNLWRNCYFHTQSNTDYSHHYKAE